MSSAPAHEHHSRRILDAFESEHGVSQRSLARELGIALGLTNLLVKLEQFSALSTNWPGDGATGFPKRIVFYGAGEVAEIGYICLVETDLQLVARSSDPAFAEPSRPLDALDLPISCVVPRPRRLHIPGEWAYQACGHRVRAAVLSRSQNDRPDRSADCGGVAPAGRGDRHPARRPSGGSVGPGASAPAVRVVPEIIGAGEEVRRRRLVWFLAPYGFVCHHAPHVDAELLFRQRIEYDDGAIVEMVLWRVPSPIPPSTHGLKYSLFYGRRGVREVGYDNERGKGDHRHFKGAEAPYTFRSVEQLVVDFWSDVHALRGEQ